jgi:hypothetical protein
LYSFKPKTKYVEDLLDTDVSDDTDISDDSSSSEKEGDEYDDDPCVEDTFEATEETLFRIETNGLLAADAINFGVCGQARDKRGYKIHLAVCKKKALKDIVNL